MKKVDYLIVGSGLYGAVFAHEARKAGARCRILERRPFVGGNCRTTDNNGIHVHEYGPHIFHTSSERIWKYVCGHTKMDQFVYRPKVRFGNSLFSFPINLFTLYQLWGVTTPEQANLLMQEKRLKIENPSNLEEWALSQIGEELYNTFVYGYTMKQWGVSPKNLPASIIKRLPVRLSFDDNYFDDTFQGIPSDGYSRIFESLLEDVEVFTEVDYLSKRDYWNKTAHQVVYSGPIDAFFGFQHGELEWRSLRFVHELHEKSDVQGTAVINYTDSTIPYTRTTEHKHFYRHRTDHSVLTYEYPMKWERGSEPFYPINDAKNQKLYESYRSMIDTSKYIFGGRLARYRYYDMHQVIGEALSDVKNCGLIYE